MVDVRRDLEEAHTAAWESFARPGSWWTGEQRLALATVVREAIDDPDPLPPWVGPSSTDRRLVADRLPDAAVDAAYRIGRHAGTITESFYRNVADQIGALAYVELCGIASSVAAVVHFHRSIGRTLPPLPSAVAGSPTEQQPTELADAELNWVPVAAPADEQAAVVQAYSAVPVAHELTWRLAAAQYIPVDEMADPEWMRRADGLTRPETELVAARVAQLRECFY